MLGTMEMPKVTDMLIISHRQEQPHRQASEPSSYTILLPQSPVLEVNGHSGKNDLEAQDNDQDDEQPLNDL